MGYFTPRLTALRKTKTAKLLGIAMLALTLVAATPGTTSANAVGQQEWGGFTVPLPKTGIPIGIPAGTLTHTIVGKGTYIKWEEAHYRSYAPLCDTQMRYTYGNKTKIMYDDIHRGCFIAGAWSHSPNQSLPRGSACAELWTKVLQPGGGVVVARQCHYIH